MDRREEQRARLWERSLSAEAKRVLAILTKGTVHKLALPERPTRELVRAGLAHESEHRIRALWVPGRALIEPRARARVYDDG